MQVSCKKKSFLFLLASILISWALFLLSSTTVQAATNYVKLYLNHNAYVYNNKGVRLRGKNTYFKKNAVIKAPGKLEQTNQVKKYYILDTHYQYTSPEHDTYYMNLFWLPYKIIKGQPYYRISTNKYIKCINVKAINNKKSILCVNEEIVHTLKHTIANRPIYAVVPYQQYVELDHTSYEYGRSTSKELPKNRNIIVDERTIFANNDTYSYHIKGTKYYIYAGDIRKPRHFVSAHPPKSDINGKAIRY